MTETTTFPFSQLEDVAVQPEATPDRRRLAIVLGAGVLAVAVLAGATFSLFGGDAATDESFFPVSQAPQVAAAPEAPVEGQTVPVPNSDALARSPFEAKYVVPAPPPAPVEPPLDQPVQPVLDASGNPVLGSDGAPILVDPGPGLVPGPGYVPMPDSAPVSGGTTPGTPPQAAPPAAPAPREYKLVLSSVAVADGVPTATFTIDGVTSTVKATEIFGPSSQLLLRSLQQGPKDGQWTATIQMGDAEPIDVVTGEPVFIR